MKKLILSLICVLVSVCGYADKIEVDGISYYISLNSTEAEVAQKSPEYSGDVVIPESFKYGGKTYTVTAIGSYAFNYCQELTSVTLPNTIKEIGNGAFYYMGNNITSIAIPNSVEKIGAGAFASNNNLERIEFKADNKNFIFEDYMLLTYDRKTLVQVLSKKEGAFVVPNTVTTLAAKALNCCRNITSITLPKSLITIEEEVFEGVRIQELNIPENVSYIAEGTFLDIDFYSLTVDPNNTSYVCENGILMDAAKTMVLANTWNASFNIPESVKKIGMGTFSNISSLKELTIPNSIEYIGKDAFENCDELEKLTIGSSVKTLETYFSSANKLTSIVSLAVTPPNSEPDRYRYPILFSRTVRETATLTVPKGSLEAYRKNSSWKEIVNIVEAENTPGGDEEVWKGNMLNGIYYTLHDDTKTAEVVPYSFYYYPELGENEPYAGDIVIPQTVKKDGQTYKVTEIADYAFEGCSITSVSLPSTIENIGINPFNLCHSLASFTIDAGNKHFVFENNMLMTVDKKHLIGILTSWTQQQCDIEMPNTIETIGSFAATNTNIASLKLSSSLRHIGERAFFAGWGFTSVVIPKSVETIEAGAFCGHANLSDLSVESGNKNFYMQNGMLLSKDGTRLLTVLTNVESFNIPESVTTLDFGFCANNEVVTSVTVPDNVVSLGDVAFQLCEKLQTVTLGKSIEYMDVPFLGCKNIKAIYNRSVTPYNNFKYSDWGWDRIFGNFDNFENEIFETCTLYVPTGCVEAYKSADAWKHFKNIEEFNPTGISSLTGDNGSNEPASVYSIGGSHIQTMQRGINIIRMQDGSVKKVLKK